MNKVIGFLILNLFVLAFVNAQEKSPINIKELSNIIYSENERKNYNQEAIKNFERSYWYLSSRYDKSGTIRGYKEAIKYYYKSNKYNDYVSLTTPHNKKTSSTYIDTLRLELEKQKEEISALKTDIDVLKTFNKKSESLPIINNEIIQAILYQKNPNPFS